MQGGFSRGLRWIVGNYEFIKEKLTRWTDIRAAAQQGAFTHQHHRHTIWWTLKRIRALTAEGESDILSGDGDIFLNTSQQPGSLIPRQEAKNYVGSGMCLHLIPQHQYPLLLMLFPGERPCLWCQH